MIYEQGMLRAGQPLAEATTDRPPLPLDVLESIPSMVGTTAISMFRTTNTMMYGPRTSHIRDAASGVPRRQGIGPNAKRGASGRGFYTDMMTERTPWWGRERASGKGRWGLKGTDYRGRFSLATKEWGSLLWNPRAWTRAASDEYIVNPRNFWEGGLKNRSKLEGVTTPFQTADMLNATLGKRYTGEKGYERATKKGGGYKKGSWRYDLAMEGHAARQAGGTAAKGGAVGVGAAGGGMIWQGGTVSRLAASGKIENMSAEAWKSMQDSPSRFMQKELGEDIANMSRREAATKLRMGTGGTGSGRMMGFVQGAMEGDAISGPAALSGNKQTMSGRATAKKWRQEVAGDSYKALAKSKAGKKIAQKAVLGFAGKYAAGAAATGPILPVLMAAYDVATIGAKLTGYAAKTYAEGYESFTSGLSSGTAGASRFVDNEVTLTHRARAVSEIQNSRLNARSALGNEGAAMAGYFG